MPKVKSKKEKKSKKSKTSPDRKKKKKKSKLSKDSRRERKSDDEEQLDADAGAECKTLGNGEIDGEGKNNEAVPIKLSLSVEPSGTANGGGGWSWGAAFATASKVQPNDDDLDDNFLKAAAASDGGGKKGVVDISQLANNHKTTVESSHDSTKNANDVSEGKLKRKLSESSIRSNDEDDALSMNSDDLSLEGRMVSISSDKGSGDMSLVLVDKPSGKVFSSGDRTQEGKRLVIGKTVKGKIKLDPMAVQEMKRLEDGGTSTPQDASTTGPSFPYETDPDDHCETPLQSYKDILPILSEMCKKNRGCQTIHEDL